LAHWTIELGLQETDSLLWNAYTQHHHYLGHQLMPGAQLRHFVPAAENTLPLRRRHRV
jgi:hypothetical protein